MGLIAQVSGVFSFLRNVFDSLPTAVRLLIYCSFGGMLFIVLFRNLGG